MELLAGLLSARRAHHRGHDADGKLTTPAERRDLLCLSCGTAYRPDVHTEHFDVDADINWLACGNCLASAR